MMLDETKPLSVLEGFLELADQAKTISASMHVDVHSIGGMTCYVSKSPVGAWLAYIDVDDFLELHVQDFEVFNDVLPFHGGCTFCQYADHIGSMKFEKARFLIGCDWCHRFSSNAVTRYSVQLLCGVEDVSEAEVLDNLREVVSFIPELRLKMTIRGNNT